MLALIAIIVVVAFAGVAWKKGWINQWIKGVGHFKD